MSMHNRTMNPEAKVLGHMSAQTEAILEDRISMDTDRTTRSLNSRAKPGPSSRKNYYSPRDNPYTRPESPLQVAKQANGARNSPKASPPLPSASQNPEERREEEQELEQPEEIAEEASSSQKAPVEQLNLNITNVMCSASLNCRLNLRKIATTGRNVEYNTRFNQVIMRIRSPRSTAMISGRGHLSCTGAHSLDDAHTAARRFARIVQKLGFPVTFSKYKVHNVLAVSQTFPVRLDRLYEELRGCSSYEPELFPGLYFHCEKVRICVFNNGKMNFTGSSDLTAYTRAFQRLYPALCKARRDN